MFAPVIVLNSLKKNKHFLGVIAGFLILCTIGVGLATFGAGLILCAMAATGHAGVHGAGAAAVVLRIFICAHVAVCTRSSFYSRAEQYVGVPDVVDPFP